MAKRLNLRQAESTREKIRASQLIKRLQKHARGEIEMSATQIRAAETCLKYALPALQSVEMDVSGDVGVTVNLVSHANNKPADD